MSGDCGAGAGASTAVAELRAETKAAVQSLVQVMSFAVGVTFASLAGTGALEPDDAANRLRLIAETLRTIDMPDQSVAEAAVVQLTAMADAISTGARH